MWNFNPEIQGFGLAQSRDFGIEKRSGIPGFGIPVLQSLFEIQKQVQPISANSWPIYTKFDVRVHTAYTTVTAGLNSTRWKFMDLDLAYPSRQWIYLCQV